MIKAFFATSIFIFAFTVTVGVFASDENTVDQELLNTLKSEANHNYNRLKSIKSEKKNNSIYDEQREKAIAQFLEEQEKWDLIRERGIAEQRKARQIQSPSDSGPEYKEDQRARRKEAEQMEKNRQVQVTTKKRAQMANQAEIADLEREELGLDKERPRYDLRRRGQNKWVKSGSGLSGKGGSSSGGYNSAPSDIDSGFPPPPVDYIPAPPPIQEFEDVPPPPPPPVYDGSAYQGYDGGYGDIPPPPPPPPPTDFDF